MSKNITFRQLKRLVSNSRRSKFVESRKTNKRAGRIFVRESDEDEDEETSMKIVTFKTTDKYLVDILQSKAGINGITISTTDDVQTFGPDSFGKIEINDWSEDDVEDDDEE